MGELLNCQNKVVYLNINTWAECDAKCDSQWDCWFWNWYGPEDPNKPNTCETCTSFDGETSDDNVISGQKNCTEREIRLPCPNYFEELLNCQNKEVYTDINTWAECDAKCDNQWDCQVWNWYGPEYSGKENTCETCIAFNGERADDDVISGQKNCTEREIRLPCPNYREELLNCENRVAYTDINTWAECDAKCDNQWDCQVWNWYGPEYSGKENTCETCIAFNGKRADDNVISG